MISWRAEYEGGDSLEQHQAGQDLSSEQIDRGRLVAFCLCAEGQLLLRQPLLSGQQLAYRRRCQLSQGVPAMCYYHLVAVLEGGRLRHASFLSEADRSLTIVTQWIPDDPWFYPIDPVAADLQPCRNSP